MPDVILPVLNEADAIPLVLARLPDGFRAVVVDNGSSDGSGVLAAGLGALVVHEPQQGFGAACWCGLLASTADIVAFMDCDGSLDPRDLPRVTGIVERGDSDLVIGTRVAQPGAWPLHARLANRLLARVVRRRTGIETDDVGPMRAARRTALVDLGVVDRRFGWPLEMVLAAHGAGWRITTTPIPYYPRTGRSKVTGTLWGTLRAAGDMARVLQRA
ncbi:MAG: glycosyltransferase family 2 protein [Actinomycetota bacterium]